MFLKPRFNIFVYFMDQLVLPRVGDLYIIFMWTTDVVRYQAVTEITILNIKYEKIRERYLYKKKLKDNILD